MSAVIDMSAWKAAHGHRAERRERLLFEPNPYCCTRCGAELFRILEGGLVRCGSCSVAIRNLKATS